MIDNLRKHLLNLMVSSYQ